VDPAWPKVVALDWTDEYSGPAHYLVRVEQIDGNIAWSSLVQSLSSDAALVERNRKDWSREGYYGRRTMEDYDGLHLPYAEQLLKGLVVRKNSRLAAEECLRVLAPFLAAQSFF
jgi:hypothetical protein